MPIDEGVIKFNATDFQQSSALDEKLLANINPVRQRLYQLGLIGQYEDINIGYGNISIRLMQSSPLTGALSNMDLSQEQISFIISGTQTGHLAQLTGEHYTCVRSIDIQRNEISTLGPIMASSESLTHGAIYQSQPEINAVIHFHNANIWQGMLHENLTHTSSKIPYGTVEMANEVKQKIGNNIKGYLAMAGHEDGVVTYGGNLNEALDICLVLYQRYVKR
ncbi:MAG: class II aldolase/adducin family protein [Bermanella sp.]